MTAEKAKALGYRVVCASPFEVGLIKNGRGLRTWWAKDFGGDLPSLGHPKILEAVEISEQLGEDSKPEKMYGSIPARLLPPDLVAWMKKELGERPSEEPAMFLYMKFREAKEAADKAEDLFHQCFRYDLAAQVAFNTWMTAKEKK